MKKTLIVLAIVAVGAIGTVYALNSSKDCNCSTTEYCGCTADTCECKACKCSSCKA